MIYKPPNKAKYIEFYFKNNDKISKSLRLFIYNFNNEYMNIISTQGQDANLMKFRVNLISDSVFSLDDQICQVFDEFIVHLSLPFNKFDKPKNRPSFIKQAGNSRYRVTYKYRNIKFNQNDEFMSDEEFEKWYSEMEKRNRVPSLSEWVKNNQEGFNICVERANSIKIQLEKNKKIVIEKWKIKGLTFKSNWSLQTCNSYLVGLLN